MKLNLKPCLDCGKPSKRRRCPEHSRAYEQNRSPNRKAYQDPVYKAFPLAGRCVVCGSTEDLTRDHIISIEDGGTNSWSNLRLLCREHNSSKGPKSCSLP